MKKISIGLLVLVALLLLATTGAQAKATMTPFTGDETVDAILDPGDVRITDGIVHIRGLTLETTFVGTISWTNIGVININMNPATGDATVWGTFAITLTSGDIRGTFEGHHVAKFTAGCGFLRFVGHGIGDLEGMGIKGTAVQDPDTCGPDLLGLVWMHDGIILDPHG